MYNFAKKGGGGSDAYEMIITSGLFFLSVFQKSGRQSIITIHILLILN